MRNTCLQGPDFLHVTNSSAVAELRTEFSFSLSLSVESWLDKRGQSLVPLSNPGSVPEISLESSDRGTLLRK